MWGARHRKMGKTKKKILERSREKNGRGKTARIALEGKPIRKRALGRDGRTAGSHLPGTDPEEPAKLTHCEILNMNKKKKKKTTYTFIIIIPNKQHRNGKWKTNSNGLPNFKFKYRKMNDDEQ